MSEVSPIRPRGRAVAIVRAAAPPVPFSESIVDFIGRAATDPAIDAGKLDALLRMRREIIAEEKAAQFKSAKMDAQLEMEPIVRDTPNKQTGSMYATLGKIEKAIRPIYTRHGFVMDFDCEPGPGFRIAADLWHRPTEFGRRYSLPAELDTVGPKGTVNKTPLHGLGSSISYARRYLKCMIWDLVLVGEDDDGNGGGRGRVSEDAGELANGKQTAELYGLLRECSASPLPEAERKFLLGVGLGGLGTLKEIPAGDFDRVRAVLLSKRNRIRQAAGAGK